MIRKYLIPSVPRQIRIILFGIIIQFSLLLYKEYHSAYNDLNRNLFIGASSIKHYLGNNFINKNFNRSSMTSEESYEKFLLLHEETIIAGVDYLYVLIKDHDDIVYAALSGTSEDIKELPNNGFWFSLKEAGDSSFEETWEAFDMKEPLFLNSSDRWGKYRSIYLPQVAEDGTIYIAGADIETTAIVRYILTNTFTGFIPFIVFMLFILPSFHFMLKSYDERSRLEDRVSFIAARDSLTGAFTREFGIKVLQRYIDRCVSEKNCLSVFLIDIDNLKNINKSRGMAAGDRMLIILKRLIEMTFRDTDKIVRLEGNKFMVILKKFNLRSTQNIYNSLERKVDNFNRHNKNNYFFRLNYIICDYKGGPLKDFIGDSLARLESISSEKNPEKKQLQDRMFKGIKNREFKTYFQPKVDINTGKISYEALVRWICPENGVIPPNKFISLAETSTLINDITNIVLEDSMHAASILGTNISINLSPVSFNDTEFFNELRERLMVSEVSKNLSFEITEGMAIDNFDDIMSKMNSLRKTGVSFSIDDFGTGYSSLSYLEKLPISEVKIDKSFIDNIDTSETNSVIVEFIVKIGDLNGFKVICEGIESMEQLHKLASLGCNNFQGYFFGKPEPFDIVTLKHFNNEYAKKISGIFKR